MVKRLRDGWEAVRPVQRALYLRARRARRDDKASGTVGQRRRSARGDQSRIRVGIRTARTTFLSVAGGEEKSPLSPSIGRGGVKQRATGLHMAQSRGWSPSTRPTAVRCTFFVGASVAWHPSGFLCVALGCGGKLEQGTPQDWTGNVCTEHELVAGEPPAGILSANPAD